MISIETLQLGTTVMKIDIFIVFLDPSITYKLTYFYDIYFSKLKRGLEFFVREYLSLYHMHASFI